MSQGSRYHITEEQCFNLLTETVIPLLSDHVCSLGFHYSSKVCSFGFQVVLLGKSVGFAYANAIIINNNQHL